MRKIFTETWYTNIIQHTALYGSDWNWTSWNINQRSECRTSRTSKNEVFKITYNTYFDFKLVQISKYTFDTNKNYEIILFDNIQVVPLLSSEASFRRNIVLITVFMGVYFLCICYFAKFGMVKIERNIGYFDLFDFDFFWRLWFVNQNH